MSISEELKRSFLQSEVLKSVLLKNADLRNWKVVRSLLQIPTNLDGFMATIYSLDVALEDGQTNETLELNLLIKVMKGDEAFRRESLSLVLFPNEINVYRNVIPVFKQLIMKQYASINTETWCPRIYLAEQGRFPAYSEDFETILVMENVQARGFGSGPPLDLSEIHLTLMARKIAQFHACSYALRIMNEEKLRTLVQEIIPLNFIENGKVVFESYDKVFRITQERLFEYLDLNEELFPDATVRSDVMILRSKFGSNPSSLMQRCLQQDDVYSVILHGDYNRNNVLFKNVDGTPVDVLMIDFQENRYGSPALDLSFFMYMNMNDETRAAHWDNVLQAYHGELLRCIMEITGLPANDVRLEPYRFNNLMDHLSHFFIYGAMIAVKFLPVMMGTPEDVETISYYFQNDIHAEKFKVAMKSSGGEEASRRIGKVMIHCGEMGYLRHLRE